MRSLLFLLVLFAVPVAQAQRFVLADTIRTAQATGLQWGDYDADGDMDLLVSATTGLAVYRSDGGRLVPLTFYDPYSDLALGTSGTWADVDADGRLELVANGMAYAITGNVLVPVEQPLYWRCKGAPDLNRDGFADRISYGTITHTLAAYEFSLNRGDCTQRQVFRELYQDDSYPSNTVADFDGDGDLDFLVGNSMALNDGATTPAFHPLVGVGGGFFPMMGSYDAAGRTTADLDDDGDLDILHPTWGDSLAVSYFGGGRFTTQRVPIPGRMQQVQIADFDGDLDPDALVLGQRGSGSSATLSFASILWNNRGALTADSTHGLPILSASTHRPSPFSFGDVDGDGDLDAAILHPSGAVTLWRNTTPLSPSRPSPLTNLRAVIEGNRVRLSWEGHDPWATYALRVGTRPGYGDVIASDAAPDGTRLLPGPGNLSTARSVTLPSVVGRRTYYWSVQQVSAGFRGSAFAPEQSFEVVSTAAEEAAGASGALLTLGPNPARTTLTVRFSAPHAATLTAFDVTGRAVLRARLDPGADTATLDVSALPSGVYVLRATSGAQTRQRTFVVAR
jgi:hypothetical protein